MDPEKIVGNNSALLTVENKNWEQFSDETEDSLLQQLLDDPFLEDSRGNTSKLRSSEIYEGFDNNTGNTWIYPKNLPIRNYQLNITKECLFRNTFVVLPTGLGKTHIAAVVMYNIYRWYPMGKIIFMAPTRPLVSQQIEACRKIMGISSSDTVEMTGRQGKKSRQDLWQTKRIFFATPQVVQSDMNDDEQAFPFKNIKLIVIDEAHKAKGRYAYVEVVQTLNSRNPYFRVLALSATPGKGIQDVAEVIKNLLISHMEIRTDNSIDVVQYTHKKNIKTIMVPLGERLTKVRDKLIQILDPYIRYLIDNEVITGNVGNMTRGWMIMEQKRFRASCLNQRHPKQTEINTNFSICVCLLHALELLERHGLRVFLNYFEDSNNQSSSTSSSSLTNEKFVVALNPALKELLFELRRTAGPNPFAISDETMTNGKIPQISLDIDFGHPKYITAKTCLLEHFEKNEESKVIIFCEFRESVMLMHRLLLQCRPIIKPRVFVGQGGTGSIRAVTQKDQIEIMKSFRSGECNTLIATSVAEEGIDVGEVDLIVCFDISSKNPIRLVQRIGRTGRKREGFVIMLATEGKEHATVKEVFASRDKTNQKLSRSRELFKILYNNSPRLVPPEFEPKCIEVIMNNTEKNESNAISKKSRKVALEKESKRSGNKMGPKSKKGKFSNPPPGSQDMRIFCKNNDHLNIEDQEVFSMNNSRIINEMKETNVIDDGNGNYDEFEIMTRNGTPKTNVHITEEENFDISSSEINALFNKLNLLGRRLDEPLPPSEIVPPLNVILRQKNVSNIEKVFILRQNYSYVRQIFESIQAINAVSADGEESLEETVNKVKEEYFLIKGIIESICPIEEFLVEAKPDEGETEFLEMERKFSDIFEPFQEREIFDDLHDFIKEQLKNVKISSFYLEEEGNFNLVQNEPVYEEFPHQSPKFTKTIAFDEAFPHRMEFEKESTPLKPRQSIPSPQIETSPLIELIKKSEKSQSENWKSPLKRRSDESPTEMPLEKRLKTNENSENVELKTCVAKEYKFNTNLEDKNLKNEDNNDFFEDDFDEMVASNMNFLTQIDDQVKNVNACRTDAGQIEEKFLSEIKANKQNFCCTENPIESMITVDELMAKLEKNPKENQGSDLNLITDDTKQNNLFSKNFDEIFEDDFDVVLSSQNDMNIDRDENSVAEVFDPQKEKNTSNNEMQQILKVGNSSQKENTSPKGNISNESNDSSPSILSRKFSFTQLPSFNPRLTPTFYSNKNISSLNSEPKPVDIREFSSQDFPRNVGVQWENARRLKRILESSESETDVCLPSPKINKKLIYNDQKIVKRRKRCEFIDDEAEDSGENGSSDEEVGLSQFALDSMFVTQAEPQDFSTTAIQAKYIKSISKSPINSHGAFKIPAQREFVNFSKVFSQPVEEDTINNTYKENSFVVSDEEAIKDNEISEICPLEKAEAILKARRKARKRNLAAGKIYGRIIQRFTEDSD